MDKKRAFVSARCLFLLALFTTGTEMDQAMDTFNISITTSSMLELVLDFIYGQTVHLTEQNILDILFVADMLQVEELVEACSQFLKSCISFHNFLPILKVTEVLFNPSLSCSSLDFILNNFPKMYEGGKEYRCLTAEQMTQFLRHDYLNVESEEMVYEIAMDWIKFDPIRRTPYLVQLLSTIRFGLFKTSDLPHSATRTNQRLLSASPEASKYLEDVQEVLAALKVSEEEDKQERQQEELESPGVPMEVETISVVTPKFRNPSPALQKYLIRPRVPRSVIFAVGGWSAGRAVAVMETYDIRTDHWYMCNESDVVPRAYHGLAVLNGQMYVTGGFNGNRHFTSVRRFHPVTSHWVQCSHMRKARCYVSTVALNGKLYAMGGFDGRTRLNSCEVYDPQANQWLPIAPMSKERSDADAAVFNDGIYVVGGFTGQEILRSVEVYNPEKDRWRYTKSMEETRSGVSLVAHGTHLYALGGFNGQRRLASVERYDSTCDKWGYVSSMNTPRSNFSAVLLDDCIYAIGGYDGKKTTSVCERYDPRTNTWEHVAPMNVERSALAVCVFTDLSNRGHYTAHGNLQNS